MPYCSNLFKYPSVLFKAANLSGKPIAFIVKGELIFSPFITITFPSHAITVLSKIRYPLTSIASAPAVFNSFTISNISVLCIISSFGS